MLSRVGSGTGTRGSLGEGAGATDLQGSLRTGAGAYCHKRHWLGNRRKHRGRGASIHFSLTNVQSGDDSQALRSGTFPPPAGVTWSLGVRVQGESEPPPRASPSACPAEPSVLDGVVNFFLLCFFTMGEGGGSRLRGLRSPDGVQSWGGEHSCLSCRLHRFPDFSIACLP